MMRGMNRDLGLQDKVVAIVGAIVALVILFALLRRVIFGKPTPPALDASVTECRKCGYYLVAADTQCPKCKTPVAGL